MAQWTVYDVKDVDMYGDCVDNCSWDTLREGRADFASTADLLKVRPERAVVLEKVTRYDTPGREAVYTVLATAGDPVALERWRVGYDPEAAQASR